MIWDFFFDYLECSVSNNRFFCFFWMFENHKSWFLGLLFLDFKVSWLLGCKVSWFQDVKDSTIAYYQISISCVQEDIDPIFTIFIQTIGWIFVIVWCPPLAPNKTFRKPCWYLQKEYFPKMIWDSAWIILRILVSPKIKNKWLCGSRTRPKISKS